MSKKIESLNIKEIRKLIREAFKHYNRKEIYKDEFYNYFKNKGYTEEEVDDLWLRTIGESKIVKWGIHFEADQLPPKKIIKRQFIKLTK